MFPCCVNVRKMGPYYSSSKLWKLAQTSPNKVSFWATQSRWNVQLSGVAYKYSVPDWRPASRLYEPRQSYKNIRCRSLAGRGRNFIEWHHKFSRKSARAPNTGHKTTLYTVRNFVWRKNPWRLVVRMCELRPRDMCRHQHQIFFQAKSGNAIISPLKLEVRIWWAFHLVQSVRSSIATITSSKIPQDSVAHMDAVN